MKIKSLIAGTIFALCIQNSGHAQSYNLSESVDNFGPQIFANSQNIGSSSWGTGNVSDTVVINPSAYTIEQSGSIYLPAAVSSISLPESQLVISTVQNLFPNPPSTVTNDVAANLTVTLDFSGGNFSFDTGAQQLEWNGSSYSFNGNTGFTVPVSISYSLVTGGQTYSGMVGNLDFTYFLTLGGQLDTTDYPGSISISPSPLLTAATIGNVVTIANFTAANGFDSSIVATVPEPASWAILGCALAAIKFVHKRKLTKE